MKQTFPGRGLPMAAVPEWIDQLLGRVWDELRGMTGEASALRVEFWDALGNQVVRRVPLRPHMQRPALRSALHACWALEVWPRLTVLAKEHQPVAPATVVAFAVTPTANQEALFSQAG